MLFSDRRLWKPPDAGQEHEQHFDPTMIALLLLLLRRAAIKEHLQATCFAPARTHSDRDLPLALSLKRVSDSRELAARSACGARF